MTDEEFLKYEYAAQRGHLRNLAKNFGQSGGDPDYNYCDGCPVCLAQGWLQLRRICDDLANL